ncbi:Ankyrin repeat-containing protein 29 [Elsinoe fawcettii]|nr:Ankyrin repeat-containing protein 29 [Elsinoe fawcettii]
MLEPLFAHHYISTLSPQETDDLFSKLDTENGESGVIDFLQTNETFDGKIPRIDRLVRWTAARGYDRFLKYTIEAVIDNLDGIPAACIRVVSLPAERFSQIFALVFDKVAVEDGRTPLLVALRKGHSQVAQVLLSWYEVHASIERVDKTGFTSLILAAMLGQCEVCSLLIRSRRCDIEATDHFHRTALHHAARQGHVDVVKLLLHTAGSDSSVQDCFIRTPLHYAAKRGHYHVANLLLEHYEDARNSSDKEYLTPLAWAAREGHVRVARLIIEKGKVEATVRYGQRQGLMMWAAANGCFELVAIFVELNEDVARSEDGEGRNPLFHASAGGHTAIVELLLSIGKVSAQAKDRNDGTALHYAAQNEHQDVAKLLLGAGADIDSKNSKGQTPLIAAITTPGNEDMVATLMRFGKADINLADEDRSTPLHLASGRFANQYVVRMLLDREDCYVHETDRKGNLAIHSAFHYCNIAILDMLLRDERCPSPALFDIEEVETRKLIYFLRKFEVEHTKHEVGQGELASLNANIRPEGLLARLIGITSHVEDVPDEHINSLVNRLPEALFAVSFRVAEIVADRAGYEINVVNKQGESALFIASASGLVDLVRLLCRYDQTEIGKSHEHGQTSLSIAAYYGHAEVVDVLIGTGKVDLGFFEYGSWTPLMYAAQRGHLDTMMVILRSGSTDTHARNLEGKTALLLASEGGHLACVKALLEDDHVTIDDVATRESLGDLVQMYTAAGAGAGQLRKPEGNLIDRRPYSSWTAHQSALVKGHLSAAGFSPIRHANIEVADHSGITPLMMATRRGDKALVQSLLEHGADADARDSKDLTALLMAIDGWNTLGLREKLVGVVKALLEHSKIDVNARTTSGETALMMAVTRRSYEIVRLLLSSGLVDTGMVDNEGLDALAKTDNTWLGYDERVALAKIGNWDLGYHMLQSGDAFDPDGVDLSEDVLPSGKWDLELDSYFGKFT